jgi:DNA mismatch endonuclease (patch repair protein)
VKPKLNADFWENKRQGNVDRDKRNEAALVRGGWKVMTIWECEVRSGEKFKSKIARFLEK